MTRYRTMSRKRLASYASVLGPNSIAAKALAYYDTACADGIRPVAFLRPNGFAVLVAGHVTTF
jgi:hypothetical protein